jgi:hypothetical protein
VVVELQVHMLRTHVVQVPSRQSFRKRQNVASLLHIFCCVVLLLTVVYPATVVLFHHLVLVARIG